MRQLEEARVLRHRTNGGQRERRLTGTPGARERRGVVGPLKNYLSPMFPITRLSRWPTLPLTAVLLFFASVAQAATLYVAKTGSDTNAGTQAAPLLTIQKAANIATPGTTVIVQPGTYNERVTLSRSG